MKNHRIRAGVGSSQTRHSYIWMTLYVFHILFCDFFFFRCHLSLPLFLLFCLLLTRSLLLCSAFLLFSFLFLPISLSSFYDLHHHYHSCTAPSHLTSSAPLPSGLPPCPYITRSICPADIHKQWGLPALRPRWGRQRSLWFLAVKFLNWGEKR